MSDQRRDEPVPAPSLEGEQLCKTCGQSEKMWQHEGCPLPACSMHHPFEPTGAGQAEAPAPAVESDGEARGIPTWSTADQPASAFVDRIISWYGGYKKAYEAIDDLRASRHTLTDELERREAAIRAQEAEAAFARYSEGHDMHCEFEEQLEAVTAERDRLRIALADIRESAWVPADGEAIRTKVEAALRPPSTESKEDE